jgi:acyl dehydratase
LLHGLKADFNAPVYVGDRLRVRGTITHRSDAARQLELVCDVTNQNSEVVSKARLRVGLDNQ